MTALQNIHVLKPSTCYSTSTEQQMPIHGHLRESWVSTDSNMEQWPTGQTLSWRIDNKEQANYSWQVKSGPRLALGNKVLLEQSHAYLFTHCLQPLSSYDGRAEQRLWRPCDLQSLYLIATWPFPKRKKKSLPTPVLDHLRKKHSCKTRVPPQMSSGISSKKSSWA